MLEDEGKQAVVAAAADEMLVHDRAGEKAEPFGRDDIVAGERDVGVGRVFGKRALAARPALLSRQPWGISLGANFFGRQGYPNPYNVRATTHDALGSRPRLLIGEVDTYRLDNLYQLDLRLEKAFKIGPVALIGSAEVFNVANSNTALQRYQRVGTWDTDRDPGEEFRPDPLFNSIQETQSPRILRLGIRLSF